jgi:RNA polymerase sigma factor (sigma-70 family)
LDQQANQNDRITAMVEKYGDLIRRICFINLRNPSDVEDVFQEVFLKLFIREQPFENEIHEKAWLCKVAFNQCKDVNKSFWRTRVGSIEDLEIPYETPEQEELIPAVLALPPEWRQIIYLHYYEEMTIPEIAGLMGKKINTVYTHLRRAKKRLEGKLKEDDPDGRF